MDKLSFIIVIVTTSVSAIITIANFVLNFLKDRKRKEERAWDAAFHLLLAHIKPEYLPDKEETLEQISYLQDAYCLLRSVDDGKYKEFLKLYTAFQDRSSNAADSPDSDADASQSNQ